MLQFRLSTLMLFLLLAAMATFPTYRHFREKPIALTPYSLAALTDQLSTNAPVVVVFHARWDIQCQYLLTKSNSMWALMRDNSVHAMSADCTNPGTPGEELMRQIGVSALPAFAVYSPNEPTNPVVVYDLATDSTIRSALSQASNSIKDRTKR